MSALPDTGQIRLLLFDVDGILTDGGLYVGESGELMKRFHIHDGAGIMMAQRVGFLVGLLSGHNSTATQARATSLGIQICHIGVKDKLAAFNKILASGGLQAEECLFMGDDFQDLPVLSSAGISVSVCDAREEVRSRVDFVTERCGGQGAVREVIDIVLRQRGLMDQAMAEFLS
jgi:3-deoxy-D-manno-octulosonate 8-phosphate phosphatase (KDO 8-P phosphatase)